MSRSVFNKDVNKHLRQISLGDSLQKPLPGEILTVTHYQFESMNSESFTMNMSCMNSGQDRIQSGRKPKIKALNMKLSSISKVLPVASSGTLLLQKIINKQTAAKDFIVTAPKEPVADNSSSQRIVMSENDTSEVLPSIASNFSRFHLLPSPKEQGDDCSYLLQKGYIEHNPHFSKYNKSVNRSSKLEDSRVIVAKDLLSTSNQITNRKSFLSKILSKKKDDLFFPIVKIIRENNPEAMELDTDQALQFKVSALGREFPLSAEIKTVYGAFEVFVSMTNSEPDPGNCDYRTREENFQVESDSKGNIRFVYFRIVALEKLSATINVMFARTNMINRRSISTLNLKSPNNYSQEPKKRQVYEFFHENMVEEEVQKMKEMIKQIKKDKKAKSLSIAGNRNLPQQNIETVNDYNEIKQSKFVTMIQKKAVLSCTNRINKDRIEAERNGQVLYNIFKPYLKQLEENWKTMQIKKKQKRINFVHSWFKTLALLPVLNFIAQNKTRIKENKMKYELLETSAIKIQKEIQTYLERPVIVKHEDEYNVRSYRRESDLGAKILASLYQATNAVALITYKPKKKKAIRTIGRMFRDMYSLDPIKEALDRLVDKVIKIQAAWKRNRQIFNARVDVFLICWRKYCRVLVQEEQRSRKKENTETVVKIKDDHVIKYAKNFISERVKVYREALADSDRVIENKSVLVQSEILETVETQGREGSRSSLKPTLRKSVQFAESQFKKRDNSATSDTKKRLSRKSSKTGSEIDILSTSQMSTSQLIVVKPRLRIQPTRPELRQIFLKIKKELKTLGK